MIEETNRRGGIDLYDDDGLRESASESSLDLIYAWPLLT